ncbi:DUF4296 domain-containing protein [Mucilaginibacter agri]|nr:DUF4296 domain-containing protein [Mucilaginibacter agri]
MRIYINLFFLGLLFLTACKSNDVPAGIIPQKKMTGLLTEVHLVDGSLYQVSQNPDSLYRHGMARYLAVFKQYGVDSTQFRKSVEYYTANPEKMQVMYDQIMDVMTAKTDSMNKVREKYDKAKTDSITKAQAKIQAAKVDSLKKLKHTTKK